MTHETPAEPVHKDGPEVAREAQALTAQAIGAVVLTEQKPADLTKVLPSQLIVPGLF